MRWWSSSGVLVTPVGVLASAHGTTTLKSEPHASRQEHTHREVGPQRLGSLADRRAAEAGVTACAHTVAGVHLPSGDRWRPLPVLSVHPG